MQGLGYDLAGQLTSTAVSGGAFAGDSTWTYDPAGNRTGQTQPGLVTGYMANALNQLTQTLPSQLQVKGLVSQAAAVQVNGVPATVAPDNSFAAQLTAPAGVQVITVTAQAGVARSTQRFQVQNGQTLIYDLDGNLTSDSIHQYDCDAAGRLIRISDLHPTVGSPAHVSEFSYDGFWRRVEIKEKQGLQTVADRHFIWSGAEIREERDASNAVVKRFYGQGVQVVSGPLGGAYYYTRDHLGSIRGLLDSSGAVVAAYDYDLWGNRTQTAGTLAADFGYAGYFEHRPSGLKLTWFRGYSPTLGRWISRDPMEEGGGMNLYGYVANSPAYYTDRLGLFCFPTLFVASTNLADTLAYNALRNAFLEAGAANAATGDIPVAAGLGLLSAFSAGLAAQSAYDLGQNLMNAFDGKMWNGSNTPLSNNITSKSMGWLGKLLGYADKAPRFTNILKWALNRLRADNPNSPVFNGCH